MRDPLIWIDMEMTGLDPDKDQTLEIAAVATNGKLDKVVPGPNLIIKTPKQTLDNMDEWCKMTHEKNGLTKLALESNVSMEEAEKQVLDFLKGVGF